MMGWCRGTFYRDVRSLGRTGDESRQIVPLAPPGHRPGRDATEVRVFSSARAESEHPSNDVAAAPTRTNELRPSIYS